MHWIGRVCVGKLIVQWEQIDVVQSNVIAPKPRTLSSTNTREPKSELHFMCKGLQYSHETEFELAKVLETIRPATKLGK
jgi:hypothetical protein